MKYIAIRNKIVMEDLVTKPEKQDRGTILPLLSEINSGLLKANTISRITEDVFVDAILASIFKVIPNCETTKELEAELRKHTEEVAKHISLGIEYEIYNLYTPCDDTCSKPRYVYEGIEQPATELPIPVDLDIHVSKILHSLDTGKPSDSIKLMMFFTYIEAVYKLIDFGELLPATIRFSGFYSISDGGEGVYVKVEYTPTNDIGVYLNIRNITYKRNYSSWVSAMWFGIGEQRKFADITRLLKYPLIIFTSGITLTLANTQTIATSGGLVWRGNRKVDILVDSIGELETIFNLTAASRLTITGINFKYIGSHKFTAWITSKAKIDALRQVTYTPDVKPVSIEFIDINKDYTLANDINFSTLPILRQSSNPKALARYQDISSFATLENYMTINTTQAISANHTYNKPIELLYAYNDNNVYKKADLDAVFKLVQVKLEAKFKDYILSVGLVNPPIGYYEHQYAVNGVFLEAETPAVIYPGTKWELVNLKGAFMALGIGSSYIDYINRLKVPDLHYQALEPLLEITYAFTTAEDGKKYVDAQLMLCYIGLLNYKGDNYNTIKRIYSAVGSVYTGNASNVATYEKYKAELDKWLAMARNKKKKELEAIKEPTAEALQAVFPADTSTNIFFGLIFIATDIAKVSKEALKTLSNTYININILEVNSDGVVPERADVSPYFLYNINSIVKGGSEQETPEGYTEASITINNTGKTTTGKTASTKLKDVVDTSKFSVGSDIHPSNIQVKVWRRVE